jgi:hypothetical protein
MNFKKSQDSSDGIAMGYGIDGPGSISGRIMRFFSIPQRSDRFRDPPTLVSNGYRGILSFGKSGRNVKLTTHFHPVPRLRMVEQLSQLARMFS